MVRNILILDSNISFAVSIKRALEATENYKVRTVTRISPALDALETVNYDLAIVDTQLSFSTITEAIPLLHTARPQLPILISSASNQDQQLVPQLRAQGFVQKPFVARMLIPIIEETLARGVAPSTAPIALAEALEEQERQELLEPMLEATRRNPTTMLEEPPTSADNSTIAEVLDNALHPEVSQRIYATIDPTPLPPDDPTLHLEKRPPIQTEAETTHASAANETLSVAQGASSLDDLLEHIRQYTSGQASGRDTQPPNPMLNPIGIMPPSIMNRPSPQLPATPAPPFTTTDFLMIEDTHAGFIPPPPRLPELEAETPVDSEATIVLPDEVLEAELVPTTLEQITQQLEAVEIETIEQSIAQDAEAMRLPTHVIAHYAVQLTQFAMENSSKGVMITHLGSRLAQSSASELDLATWDAITDLINENWSHPGDSRTRVLYRKLAIGEVILYSILTVQDFILSLIFSADTPLKIIRRQAAQLTEALLTTPPPTEAVIYTEPTPKTLEVIEPIALPIQPSEETPPDQPPAPPIALVETPEPAPLERSPGTYTSYACAWTVDDPHNTINAKAALMIEGWLREICQEQDWEVESLRVEREWVYIALNVPMGVLPSAVASTLMSGTAERALALDPRRSADSPWSAGYLIRTPPDHLKETDIQRFIQFYRSTRLAAS